MLTSFSGAAVSGLVRMHRRAEPRTATRNGANHKSGVAALLSCRRSSTASSVAVIHVDDRWFTFMGRSRSAQAAFCCSEGCVLPQRRRISSPRANKERRRSTSQVGLPSQVSKTGPAAYPERGNEDQAARESSGDIAVPRKACSFRALSMMARVPMASRGGHGRRARTGGSSPVRRCDRTGHRGLGLGLAYHREGERLAPSSALRGRYRSRRLRIDVFEEGYHPQAGEVGLMDEVGVEVARLGARSRDDSASPAFVDRVDDRLRSDGPARGLPPRKATWPAVWRASRRPFARRFPVLKDQNGRCVRAPRPREERS